MNTYKSPATYFSPYSVVSGVNADIARHRDAIKDMEERREKEILNFGDRPNIARHYEYFIRLAKDSLAIVTDKGLGRNK